MAGKKVLIVGTGVQGSTVAKWIDAIPQVAEIICADRDEKAVNELVASLKKGRGAVIDCADKDSIVALAKEADVLVNALPMPVMQPSIEAAIEAEVDYLDFNAPVTEMGTDDLMEAYDLFLNKYNDEFKRIGKICMANSGVAPGMINALARYTMRYLDSCHTIMMIYNEGLRTKRFIPFWWSPRTAFEGMMMPGFPVEDGKVIIAKPYCGEIVRNWPELGRDTSFYEHGHPEPSTIGYHGEEYYKGVKNVYFKYGGAGIEFAKPLYDLGLLSDEEKEYNGAKFVPFDYIADHLPPAPKYKDEIKAIIDEGIIEENSCCVVESTGMKDGEEVMIEAHVFSPGLIESFEKMEFTSEMYQTGMSGALFTRMLLEEKVDRKGVVTSDMFTDEEVDCFFKYAKEEGHQIELKIRGPIKEDNIIVAVD